MSSVAVIGAGLVGCLAAIGFSKKGYQVSVYELRDDPRKSTNTNLRSINLAVSSRGINALKYVDEELSEAILSKVIPMYGRMIHINGNEESQRYDIDGQAINSIDREYLNNILLDEAEKLGIELNFNHKLIKMDLNKELPVLTFQNKEPIQVKFVIGSDGAFSKVRQELQKFVRMDYNQEYIDCAYLELSIAANENAEGDDRFKLDKNHLHIWPKHDYMLIALPNLDGSFTSTFFAPWKLIESLNTDELVLKFFNENFGDAVNLITPEKLLYAFNNHPKGKLLTLNCNTYHFQDKCIIIGDAAHAMVPFYGQGMNCGFEDVFVLLSTIDKFEGNLEKSFESYSANRREDLLAITYLAKQNYKEMSHKVTSKIFLVKKQIDFLLTYLLKDRWIPLYTMVSFRADINYAKALRTFKRQDKILAYLQAAVFGALSFGVSKLLKAFWRRA